MGAEERTVSGAGAHRSLATDIADRIEGLGEVTVHRYFGGQALRTGGVQFAFVMKGTLYLRVDEASRPDYIARGASPFAYRGAAGRVTVTAYYEAPGELVDDAESLAAWCADAVRAASKRRKRPAPR